MDRKSGAQLAAIVALVATLLAMSQAAPSTGVRSNQPEDLQLDNLLQEESRGDEIQDDLTAADLDLDGAAATPETETDSDSENDADDEAPDASSANEFRWNGAGNEDEPARLDSNIENAKIHLSPKDMATAAGHHHHHGHYVHGWLKMGAETGKKGAFKWHDKHPVGGKGR